MILRIQADYIRVWSNGVALLVRPSMILHSVGQLHGHLVRVEPSGKQACKTTFHQALNTILKTGQLTFHHHGRIIAHALSEANDWRGRLGTVLGGAVYRE
jgi:hypothetical protein